MLFLVHLDILVNQTYEKMQAFGLNCGFIKAGWEENREAPIQIASIQTMARRRWWKTWPADIVFYDEGHITLFSKVGMQALEIFPNAIHLVMTATPERLGKEQLGDYMETFVASPVPSDLQRQGFLAPMRYATLPEVSSVNVAGVKTIGGDYETRSLRNACDRPELVQKIVEEWHRLCLGLRTIAFCVDTDHAEHVAEAFRAAGVPAACVKAATPRDDRKDMYKALRQENILVLTSCNVISIGFDEPSVEVGLLLRPTQSSALHQQQIGRVMRISPETGKQCGLILDQSGNLRRLGFPENIDRYFLPTSKVPTQASPPPIKHCPTCTLAAYNFAAACTRCGFQWPQLKTACTDSLVMVAPGEIASIITENASEVIRTWQEKYGL